MKRSNIKFILMIISICIVFMIQGCSNIDTDLYWLPETDNANEIVLFRHWDTRFVLYNMDTRQITKCNKINQFFQFEFEHFRKYYTAGDSDEGAFRIVQLQDNKFTDVVKLQNKKDAIFPLASDEKKNNYFFLVYRGATGEEREIVRLDEKGNLISYLKTTDAIMSGILAGDQLYYSVYNKDDTYDVYVMDITRTGNKPELAYTGVKREELYYYEGEIFFQDSEKIYSNTRSFESRSDNHFYEEYKILVQIGVAENANLSLTITDTNTNKVIKEVLNPIDFVIEEDIMTVYCDGTIEKIDLSDRKVVK